MQSLFMIIRTFDVSFDDKLYTFKQKSYTHKLKIQFKVQFSVCGDRVPLSYLQFVLAKPAAT